MITIVQSYVICTALGHKSKQLSLCFLQSKLNSRRCDLRIDAGDLALVALELLRLNCHHPKLEDCPDVAVCIEQYLFRILC